MSQLTDPADNAVAITPHDTNQIAQNTRGVSVNVSGNIKVDFVTGGTAIVIAVIAGVIYPFRLKRIYATDTTATGIVAYW